MSKLKANKRPRPDDLTKAAIGVAGVVRKAAIAQNAFLAHYAPEDPEAAPAAVYRREIFDGRPHTVFPVVMAVEGVLNDALVSELELSKSVPAWNGRPVVLLHPEEMGVPISASAYPDVLERRVGTLFAASMEGKRLKAELWIDDQKMDYLGASALVASMLAGEVVEVSTGYFSDDVIEQGEFNGATYVMRHTNLRPDHLALLPGQVGACSIADGCGAPRVNRKRGLGVNSKIRDAIATLSKAVGIHTNSCDCQECKSMNKLESVRADFKKLGLSTNAKLLVAVNAALGLAGDDAFKANKGLESKHLKMLEDMDEGQLDMMSAMIQAYKATDPAAAADEPPADEDPAAQAAAAAKANRRSGEPVSITKGELDTLVANASKKAVEEYAATHLPQAQARADVTAKLKSNAANPFSDEELASLPVSALEKTELALRANDFTGAGGYSGTGGGDDEPLAVTANRRAEEAAKARRERRSSH